MSIIRILDSTASSITLAAIAIILLQFVGLFNPAGKGGVRHKPDRSRHAVRAVSTGDGHYFGRYGDAATVRGRTRLGPKWSTIASCARPAVSTAAGILGRTTRSPRLSIHDCSYLSCVMTK